MFFVVSIALCLSGFVVMGINSARDVGALNYSLDFVGGTATTVTFDKEYTLEEVDSQMVPELEKITGDKNVQVQTVKGTNQVVFKTQTLDLEKREAFESYMQNEFGVKEEIATENISYYGKFRNENGCGDRSYYRDDLHAFVYLVQI